MIKCFAWFIVGLLAGDVLNLYAKRKNSTEKTEWSPEQKQSINRFVWMLIIAVVYSIAG